MIFDNYFDDWLFVSDALQAKMLNICWFQLHKCKTVAFFSVVIINECLGFQLLVKQNYLGNCDEIPFFFQHFNESQINRLILKIIGR